MFHGSLVALVTPMQPDGTVDIESLRSLVEWHITHNTNGIVILGTTGESVTLTPGEHNLVIQEVLAQVNQRVPVIAGTGSNSTSTAVHMTRAAMELGVDASLVVTPYYNKPTQEGLYQHFKTIAEEVPLPMIMYNVPSRTGCDLKPETVGRLCNISNIIGLKEATGDLTRVKTILSLCNAGLDLYSGDDETAMEFILAGGKGVISVTANVAPQIMSDMCAAALAGQREQAITANQLVLDLHQKLFVESNPIPVKWALHEMGMIPSGIRLPLTVLADQYHEIVRSALRKAGALNASR